MADRIRHLVRKANASGQVQFYWQPSATLKALGLTAEALGPNERVAVKRALELNALADDMRRDNSYTSVTSVKGSRPGTVSRLFNDYLASDELGDLKPRTRDDYRYYLGKIELEFGEVQVRAISARVVKEYYKRVRREKGIAWSYHILATLRAALSWAVSEDWIETNPALDVQIKSPAKRRVIWAAEEAEGYIAKAKELGWHSMAAMAAVFDCIGQSPIDVRTLKRGAYDGSTIAVTRAKTGVSDAPIPLWAETRAALDAYLATRLSLHPEASLFVNDKTQAAWVESTLHKTHAAIRKAAGLRPELQMQDFRRTAQTEAGAAGATSDEIRGFARHTTRSAGEHYVMPDSRFVEAVQMKRLTLRRARKRDKS